MLSSLCDFLMKNHSFGEVLVLGTDKPAQSYCVWSVPERFLGGLENLFQYSLRIEINFSLFVCNFRVFNKLQKMKNKGNLHLRVADHISSKESECIKSFISIHKLFYKRSRLLIPFSPLFFGTLMQFQRFPIL